jgi:dimethyl sulfoxide reductase membrane subunit
MKPSRAGIALLWLLVVAGVYSGIQQWMHGDAVTGLGTIGAGGVVWGLYVVGDGFFASVALASLTMACLARVLRLRSLEPMALLALPLAIASLLASVVCVLADLGRPWDAMINLSLVGRARAPFFSTFTLVAGASLCASLIHLALASRPAWAQSGRGKIWRVLACGWTASASARHRRGRVDFWLSLALLPLLVVGLVMLGVVFSARSGRPVWLIRFEAVTFMVSAAAAGGSLLLLALAARKQASAVLGRVVAVLVVLTAFFVVSGQILALRAPGLALHRYAQGLLVGSWSALFLTELALLFVAATIVIVKAWSGRVSRAWAAITAALVCGAVFLHRFLLLVVWQTHGQGLDWPTGDYHPTWVEWGVLLGVAASAVLVFLFLLKSCPVPTQQPIGAAPPTDKPRVWVAGLSLLLGSSVAAAGLALSSGLGSKPFLDPILAGSPLLFLGGLILMLSTALVYELYPERPRAERS